MPRNNDCFANWKRRSSKMSETRAGEEREAVLQREAQVQEAQPGPARLLEPVREPQRWLRILQPEALRRARPVEREPGLQGLEPVAGQPHRG